MEDLLSWDYLATDLGAVTMVTVISGFTKELKFVKKIGSQIWNYLISLAVIYPTLYFTGGLNGKSAVLAIFKAFMIALTASGSFDMINKVKLKISASSNSSSSSQENK